MSKLLKLLSIISIFRGARHGGGGYGYRPRAYHHRSFKTYLAERVLRRFMGRRH